MPNEGAKAAARLARKRDQAAERRGNEPGVSGTFARFSPAQRHARLIGGISPRGAVRM